MKIMFAMVLMLSAAACGGSKTDNSMYGMPTVNPNLDTPGVPPVANDENWLMPEQLNTVTKNVVGVLFGPSQMCSTNTDVEGPYLQLSVSDPNGVTAGTYHVVTDTNTVTAHAFVVASVSTKGTSADAPTEIWQATDGNVTISALDGNTVTGTYEVTMPSAYTGPTEGKLNNPNVCP